MSVMSSGIWKYGVEGVEVQGLDFRLIGGISSLADELIPRRGLDMKKHGLLHTWVYKVRVQGWGGN